MLSNYSLIYFIISLFLDSLETKNYYMKLKEVFELENADEKSLNFILNALSKSNLDGFDYIEFAQAVKRLQDMPMDESMALKSAYSTVSTIGLSKDKLVKSAQYYLDVLAKERKVFKQSVEDRKILKIERQKRKMQTILEEIEKLETRKKQITEKLALFKKEYDDISGSLDAENEKIIMTERAFDDTISRLAARIEKDIEKINHTL